ncbi:MAG: hypothetical protein RL757_2845 [Bacteroidota bacterium]|jgi:hypothetical protein
MEKINSNIRAFFMLIFDFPRKTIKKLVFSIHFDEFYIKNQCLVRSD